MGNGEWGMGSVAAAACSHKAANTGRAEVLTKFPIVFVGDRLQTEFSEVADWLEDYGAAIAPDVPAALTMMGSDLTPALIVLALPWPGCFSVHQIEQLRYVAPLARLIGLQGTWLEGETRTGKPLPGVERIRWHHWKRIVDRLEKFETQGFSAWATPITAGNDERLLATATPSTIESVSASQISIGIMAQHREIAQSLTEVCSQCGWKSKWMRNVCDETSLDYDVILFDVVNSEPFEFEVVAKLRAENRAIPIVVLQGFPRSDELLRWKQSGAAAIISKPLIVDELVSQIQVLARQLQ